REVDDPGVRPGEDLVAQAQGLDGAVREVVDHHVGRPHQAQEERAGLRRALEVDGDRSRVAVQEVEVGRGAGRHAARLVALAGPLHLDDVGAQVGQQEPRGRAGDDVAELEDAEALEGERAGHRPALYCKRPARSRASCGRVAGKKTAGHREDGRPATQVRRRTRVARTPARLVPSRSSVPGSGTGASSMSVSLSTLTIEKFGSGEKNTEAAMMGGSG